MSLPALDTARARFEHPHEDPTLSKTAITHSSWHRALGILLRYDTNDVRIQEAAIDMFGPPLEPPGEGVHPDALMRLFVHFVPEEADFRPRQPLVRTYGELFTTVASRASSMSGNIATGEVMGYVSETVANLPDFLRICFVQSSFLRVVQSRMLVAVHSACLARGGRAVMLRGESGSGKSTLCYAALRAGWSMVAEDVIFLRSRSGRSEGRVAADDIELHGLPWTLHLLPDAVELFPELLVERLVERPDGKQKIVVKIAERFPGQTQPAAPLGPLVFVERAPGTTAAVARIERDEALARLRATAIHYEEDRDARHGVWDAFLSLPAYRLLTGDDPARNAAMLENILRDDCVPAPRG